MKPLRISLLLSALALLSGCAVGPDYQRPDAIVAQQWQLAPGWQAGQPRDGELKGAWWEVFGDADLNTLQQKALQDGQTLRMAQARLDQARAQANVANSALFPHVGLQAGASRDRTSAERPVSNYGAQNASVVQNDFNAGFTVSYELDLFGRVRRQVESASAGAEQAQADFENVRLVLTAELAADYFALREADAEMALLEKALQAQKQALAYISDRHQLGAASGLDFHQQEAVTAATQTQLTLLRDQRSRYQNALATLLGVPAPEFSLPRKTELAAIPVIPLLAPTVLLERRPDIAAAERAMAVANAQIGVAKSAYYPSLSLSGLYGSEANDIANLFSAPATLWALGVSATQTLFDAGRTRAGVAFSEAGYQQTVASYRQTVLVAMQEVQDGLNGTVTLADAHTSAKRAADSAGAALSLSVDRYKLGAANHLEVVVAEQGYLNYQRQVVQLHGQQLLNAVRLVKALGGGWHEVKTGEPAR